MTRPDLGDRAIFLTLPPIADVGRRPEQNLWQDFLAARPFILGALLDALSHGLRKLPQVHIEQLRRMADFIIWGTACETALWLAGHGVKAPMLAHLTSAVEHNLINASPVTHAVRAIMATRVSWTGTASDLSGRGRSCRWLRYGDPERRVAKKSAGSGWPTASRANISSGSRH